MVGHVAVALYPFQFDPPGYVVNRVEWRAGDVLAFSGPMVVARTEGPAEWLPAVIQGGSFSLELKLRTSRVRQYGPARVLTVSRSTHDANIVVGQFGSDLVIRMRRAGSGPDGTPELFVVNALADMSWHDVRIAVGGGALTVAVDGSPQTAEVIGDAALAGWDPTYRLALGNEVAGHRPWRGEIRRALVALPDRTVDLLEPGRLRLPNRVWYFPDRLGQLFGVDTFTGRLLLLPRAIAAASLGMMAFLLWGRRLGSRVPAIALGILLLVIEVAKVAFDGRHPSTFGVAAQWSGVALGVWVGVRLVAWRT